MCNWKITAKNLELIKYRRPSFIPSSLPRWMNIIENTSRLTEFEKVYGDERNKNILPMLLRPEQKSEKLFKTLMNKYSEPGDLVFDPFLHIIQPAARLCCCQRILDAF